MPMRGAKPSGYIAAELRAGICVALSARRIDAPAVVRAGVALAILHAAMEIDFADLARAYRAVHIHRAILHARVADLAMRTAWIAVAIRGAALADTLRSDS